MSLGCTQEQFQLEEKGCTDQVTADYKGKLEAKKWQVRSEIKTKLLQKRVSGTNT